jgi:hypothetical protein
MLIFESFWSNTTPKRGPFRYSFSPQTLSTLRTCFIFLLSAERAESKNQQPFRISTCYWKQDTLNKRFDCLWSSKAESFSFAGGQPLTYKTRSVIPSWRGLSTAKEKWYFFLCDLCGSSEAGGEINTLHNALNCKAQLGPSE